MNFNHKGLWIGIGIVVLLVGMMVSSYNGLVKMSENVNGKWSQVENQLQRKADLIPNLVSTVKGYAAHEQKVMQDVTSARAKLGGAKGPEAKANANEELNGALSRLLVVVESYPNLKANENFLSLQAELAGTENRITVARQDYNKVVQEYTTYTQQIPGKMWASMFGFEKKEYFKASEEAKKPVKVEF